MRKFILYLVLFFILIFTAIAGYVYWNVTRKDIPSVLSAREKQRALTQILGHSPEYKAIVVSGKTYIGNVISVVYPSNANLRVPTPDAGYLDSVVWHSVIPYLFIAIDVRLDNTMQSVTDDSSVKIRLQNSNYVHRSFTWQGIDGIEFTKSVGGIEQSAFFFSSHRFYSFAVTGDAADSVTTEMKNILTSAKILSK